jgi:hypothetical protein
VTKLEEAARAMEISHKALTTYLDLARTVVEALRQPNEAMRFACFAEGMLPTWETVIDTILNEGESK